TQTHTQAHTHTHTQLHTMMQSAHSHTQTLPQLTYTTEVHSFCLLDKTLMKDTANLYPLTEKLAKMIALHQTCTHTFSLFLSLTHTHSHSLSLSLSNTTGR